MYVYVMELTTSMEPLCLHGVMGVSLGRQSLSLMEFLGDSDKTLCESLLGKAKFYTKA